MFITLIYFFVLMFLINKLYTKSKSKTTDQPPELSGKIPLLGHSLVLIGDSFHCWEKIKWFSTECLQKGGVIRMTLGFKELYLVADPDDCATIANQCVEKPEYYAFGRPWIGEALFIASSKVWKKHRKLLNPSFTPQVVNGFVSIFNDQARLLVKEFEDVVNKGQFNHFPYLSNNGLMTTFYTVLGDQNYVKDAITQEYLNSVQEIQNLFTQRWQKFWLHSDFIFNRTFYKKRQDELLKILHTMSYNVLQKKKTEMATRKRLENQYHECKGKFKPFLDLLLELALEDNLLTDKEVKDEVDGIIIAAYDTLSNAHVFIFNMLGSYPEVQERAYREILEVLGDSNRDLDKNDVHKLVYLDAVIKETLRLYPLGPALARCTESDVKLKKYTVPKNKIVLMLFWAVHHHTGIWGEDAGKFRPERWLDPATLPESPNAFGGFSLGTRNCIGKAYAMLSMKILLAHVIRKYRITADESKMKIKVSVTLKADHGHEIALELRAHE